MCNNVKSVWQELELIKMDKDTNGRWISTLFLDSLVLCNVLHVSACLQAIVGNRHKNTRNTFIYYLVYWHVNKPKRVAQ